MVRLLALDDDPAGRLSRCRACKADTRGPNDMLCAACWKRVPQSAKDAYLKVWRLAVLYERKTGEEMKQAEHDLVASIPISGVDAA